jgi:1-acyl-sn-glycerol-3-phosphate acyltransferase
MVRYGIFPLNTFLRMTWEILPSIEPEKRPVEEVVLEAEQAIRKSLGQAPPKSSPEGRT